MNIKKISLWGSYASILGLVLTVMFFFLDSSGEKETQDLSQGAGSVNVEQHFNDSSVIQTTAPQSPITINE